MKKLTAVAFACMTLVLLAGCRRIPDKDAPYVTEKSWGLEVTSVDNCYQTKRHNYCVIQTADGRQTEREMSNWPGGTIQRGDRLGTLYKVGDNWVETWRLRSTSTKMVRMDFCYKDDPKCTWPSKEKGSAP